MKNWKKMFAGLVSAVLVVTMAACGGETASQAPDSSSPSSAVSEESSQSEAAVPAVEASQPEEASSVSSSSAPEHSQAEAPSEEAAVESSPAESASQPEEEPEQQPGGTLVVYFSATGNTQAVAETIADTLGADLYEIVPEEPYTDADLNWNDPDSRVNTEHEDPSARPAIAGGIPDLSSYDTILIGYPLWWREAPPIVWNFVETADLAGKTMIPFCTSMSDGIGSSGDTLAGMAPNATWLAGQRFGENLDAASVTQWVQSLGLDAAA